MTEQEWLIGGDPTELVHLVNWSERKWRLFASASCRRIWPQLTERESREAVVVAEQYADGQASQEELAAAEKRASLGGRVRTSAEAAAGYSAHWISAVVAALNSIANSADAGKSKDEEVQAQCAIVRELTGNPFRPVSLDSALLTWHDATIPKLAQAAYDERELPSGHLDAKRLAILADALEEAGCTSDDVLTHLRGTGPHVRGCWVVDLLLGKE